MAEWAMLTLREAGVSLIDCDHRTPPASDSGYPYVAIPQIKTGRIDLTSVRRITHEHFVEWTRKVNPKPYDVILSRRCNPGETAFVPPGLEFALGQNLVLLRANDTKVFPPFLRWLVRGTDWWEQIGKFINVGAVFDSLKCADIPNFCLPIPPLSEQREIASLLGAIDDKIDLNRRMNDELEAMARLFFKDWFIDFGPTRAKAEGRPSYLVPELWSLFPNALNDGDKPMGWETSTIGQEVRVVGGSTPSTKEPTYWDGDLCWATPKDLSSLKAPVLLKTERRITQAGISQISSGLLPSGTVLLSSRAPIGYLVISQVETAVNQGFIAMICEGRLKNVFTWLWTQANMDAIHQKANGSTFQEISKANFRPIPVIVADPPILRAFDEIAQPLYKQIVANEQESRTLAQTRDLLLPKLMSGEIHLREAEKLVEHAL